MTLSVRHALPAYPERRGGAVGADLVDDIADAVSARRFVARGAGSPAYAQTAGGVPSSGALAIGVAGTASVVEATLGRGGVRAVFVGEAGHAGVVVGVALGRGGCRAAIDVAQALDTAVAFGVTHTTAAIVCAQAFTASVGGWVAELAVAAIAVDRTFHARAALADIVIDAVNIVEAANTPLALDVTVWCGRAAVAADHRAAAISGIGRLGVRAYVYAGTVS